jgi:hypothetical protein
LLIPIQVHLLVVLNLVKDRKRPCIKGQIKPIQKDATMGARKIGAQYCRGLRRVAL